MTEDIQSINEINECWIWFHSIKLQPRNEIKETEQIKAKSNKLKLNAEIKLIQSFN